ncbi:flavodoxin [Rubrivivax gelatinosus]|uniref:Flavodoxin n=1 Tax=Rubrivivax gelatinosus TaxID=28068 RepID=A0ABS1DS36_RUBGE|nr:flavodoxin FldA [Rubrivivax gelatinosus]MBK1616256.1 flavodoxin [Rubrivivax gelatinosus]MBK1712204.1 flavodoxin [Rubrivivax gelatinosus]MBZ8143438.1 flavodoxin [Rubrivivax gelatinosus]
MSVTIIYGSDGGCTRKIANKIASKTGGRALDIKKAEVADFENASLLILGCPTYADGELQSDWLDHLDKLEQADLGRCRVAIFGTGDQVNYPGSFVDAIGILYDIAVERGAQLVGHTDPAGYDFSESAALRDGRFLGLAIDEDNQAGKTEARVTQWLATIR